MVFGQEGGGDDRNVGKRRCGQSVGGRWGATTEKRMQRTAPWLAFRGRGGRSGIILYCKGYSALFIAGAAKLEAVVISNSCMVYMVFVLKQPFLYSNHARHAGSLL